MGTSRGEKRKEKGKSYRGNNNSSEIGGLKKSDKKRQKKKDAWKEKFI
jgi:hypothetical protein